MAIEMDKLKTILEQYLSVAEKKKKARDMIILMKDISHYTGSEKN